MKIDLIVDLQFGSTGKGLLAGYLAETMKPDGVATCNMPNAGHTYIDQNGHKMIHKVLPNGVVSPNCKYAFIGPGAVFSIDRLRLEVEELAKIGYDHFTTIVHPNAVILMEEYAQQERSQLSMISSTMQGSLPAQFAKMERKGTPMAIDWRDEVQSIEGVYVVDYDDWMTHVGWCKHILAEGSQGFSLGLNQRFWPYCTSRECTPYRMLSDMGLPQIYADTWGTLRTYPIRVGNTENGWSGDYYPDQTEVSWAEIGQEPEYTTVTGRERRVFTFSRKQVNEALWHCRPDKLFLNFCNYMNPGDLGRLVEDIESAAINNSCGGIRLYGYGPRFEDVYENPGQVKSKFR
jgi:adenylosuccinate synthase